MTANRTPNLNSLDADIIHKILHMQDRNTRNVLVKRIDKVIKLVWNNR